MIKSKKLMCLALSALLAAGIFAGCGKKATDSGGLAENSGISKKDEEHSETVGTAATPFAAETVPDEFRAEGDNITARGDGGVDVSVDVREGDDRYELDDEDLGFVDTMSGALIRIGMSIDEIESLIGPPKTIDSQRNRFYSGIAIQYDQDMNASRIVAASGNMEGSDDPERFVTPRGIKLGSTMDEFVSVYGDDYNDAQKSAEGNTGVDASVTRALRYYTQNGDDFDYVGSSLVGDGAPQVDPANLVTQMFIFSPETGNISVITIEKGAAN